MDPAPPSWDLNGQSYGPYTGTWTDVGTLTFGPLAADWAGNIVSPVTSMESHFEVTTAAGVIRGDTQLLAEGTMAPKGLCSYEIPGTSLHQMLYQGSFAWDITLTTADSVYAQSGTGHMGGYQIIETGVDNIGFYRNFNTADTAGLQYVAPVARHPLTSARATASRSTGSLKTRVTVSRS